MPRLLLVRHGTPAFRPDVEPRRWPLAPSGVAAARRLDLPTDAYLVASDEQKAWQTLAYAGCVAVDSRFAEVRRDNEPWDGPFRELRRSFVEGTDHDGWEPRADVAARFDAAVQAHLTRAADRALVIASHGMAMTVWLAARVGLTDPGAFWAALRFPDAVPVDYR